MFRKLVSVCAAAVFLIGTASEAHAVTTLKIATNAPSDSPWGRAYKKFTKAVADGTNGDLVLDFQFNGAAGDEALVVQKIRAGQIDGGALTSTGLVATGVTDATIFGLPGLFTNWAKLDEARNAVKDDLQKEFEAKGFSIIGWGDVGAAKTMTVGFRVDKPDDMRGKGCFVYAGDPIGPRFFAAMGGMTPKTLAVSEVLPALTNGSITDLVAPPLGAEQMQWASRITHVSSYTSSFVTGAMLVSTARLQSLPPADRQVLMDKSREMGDQLTGLIRNLDAQAYARMKVSKVVYDPVPEYKKLWVPIYNKFYEGLRGAVFTPAIFDRVLAIAQPQNN